MSDEMDLPRWVIRRYIVVKNKKVDRFEALPEATHHRHGETSRRTPPPTRLRASVSGGCPRWARVRKV